MERNFFEVLILEPKETNALANEKVLNDFQEVADILMSREGTIDARFRKSIDADHPERLLFVAAWKTIEDHDEFDIQGLVPKLLKLLATHANMVAAHFMFMDSRKVNFDAPVWSVNIFHVEEKEAALFQKEIDINTGLAGAWYAVKKMPPLPKVMPTDPVELKVWEEMMKRAEARLQAPPPNIWMSISSSKTGDTEEKLREKVASYIEKVESGQFEMYIDGRRTDRREASL